MIFNASNPRRSNKSAVALRLLSVGFFFAVLGGYVLFAQRRADSGRWQQDQSAAMDAQQKLSVARTGERTVKPGGVVAPSSKLMFHVVPRGPLSITDAKENDAEIVEGIALPALVEDRASTDNSGKLEIQTVIPPALDTRAIAPASKSIDMPLFSRGTQTLPVRPTDERPAQPAPKP